MLEITFSGGSGAAPAHSAHPSRVHLLIRGDYTPEACLSFSCGERFLWVQPDQAIAPALVYLPNGTFEYRIPSEVERAAYPPQAFIGALHLVRAWLPSKAEIASRRNLALNPADQRGETCAYPHASANVETRNEAAFAARNVIDGALENTFHGEWPYQSWGIGAREDAYCTLDFGRPVCVDEMALVLRADFPHDAYWLRGDVSLSDGAVIPFTLQRTGNKQLIPLGTHTVRWMRLENLVKSDDPSAFPALTEWEVYGTEEGVSPSLG